MDELNSEGRADYQLMKSPSHAPSLRKFESVLIRLMDTTVNHCRLHTKGLLHLPIFICAFQRKQSRTLPRFTCCFVSMSIWSPSRLSLDGHFLKHDKTIEEKYIGLEKNNIDQALLFTRFQWGKASIWVKRMWYSESASKIESIYVRFQCFDELLLPRKFVPWSLSALFRKKINFIQMLFELLIHLPFWFPSVIWQSPNLILTFKAAFWSN